MNWRDELSAWDIRHDPQARAEAGPFTLVIVLAIVTLWLVFSL